MKSSRSSLAGLIAMAAGLMTGQAAIGTDRKPRETDNWGIFRQHTNPERNARRKFKRQVGARQAYEHAKKEAEQAKESEIRSARNSAVAPYALVMDGQWFAKGRMGWFGMSDDKLTQDEWNTKVNELLDSLPDDTLLTVVDCHI